MIEINDVKFEFTEDKEIKIYNSGDTRYVLKFIDPRDGFLGYSNFYFHKFVWVQSKMDIWPNKPTLIDVILLSNSNKIHLKVDFEKQTFTDISLYDEVVDGNVKPHEVSIIIPAYKTTNYLDIVLSKFIEQMKFISDIQYEILVGIDNCYETLEYISKSNYGDNIKFYFFKENVGPFFVRNSLATISQYKNIIFFDSDDIPTDKLVKEVVIKLKTNDMVRYFYNEYIEGKNPDEFPNYGLHIGSFGIKRDIFFSLGGFYPWRIAADTEFRNRSEQSGIKIEIIEDFLMYYRMQIEGNQLTRNTFSGYGSELRKTYEKIIVGDKIKNEFTNPEEIKTVPFIRVY